MLPPGGSIHPFKNTLFNTYYVLGIPGQIAGTEVERDPGIMELRGWCLDVIICGVKQFQMM